MFAFETPASGATLDRARSLCLQESLGVELVGAVWEDRGASGKEARDC